MSGVIAMRMLGLFLILPVFMLLAVDVPGYTPLMAGLAIGIYGLTQALLQQPFGRLSDMLWIWKPSTNKKSPSNARVLFTGPVERAGRGALRRPALR